MAGNQNSESRVGHSTTKGTVDCEETIYDGFKRFPAANANDEAEDRQRAYRDRA